MGSSLTKFGKEKQTSYEILENLEQKITLMEQSMKTSQERYVNIVHNLLNVTLILYMLSSILIYAYFSPKTWMLLLVYMSPLLIVFPLAMLATKKIIMCFYNNKHDKYMRRLNDLKTEKSKVLDEVMEKENYKTARCLLERFSERVGSVKSLTASVTQSAQSLQSIDSNCSKEEELNTVSSSLVRRTTSNPIPAPTHAPCDFPGRILPRPILSSDRTFLDKVIDYIANDGASNRYAMICKQCHNHNGMALKEEFQYLAYRCAFCGFYNPARKLKPVAPGLGCAIPQRFVNAKLTVAETSKTANSYPNMLEPQQKREKCD